RERAPRARTLCLTHPVEALAGGAAVVCDTFVSSVEVDPADLVELADCELAAVRRPGSSGKVGVGDASLCCAIRARNVDSRVALHVSLSNAIASPLGDQSTASPFRTSRRPPPRPSVASTQISYGCRRRV